jgi:hypothetical protein
MGQPALDFPDPMETRDDVPLARTEDLLSQLAGEEVDRLLSDGPEGASPPRVGPVEELTAQLDTFFHELRQREATPPARAFAPEERVEIGEDERALLDPADFGSADEDDEPAEMPRAMLRSMEIQKPPPTFLRPLNWFAGPIESLTPTSRAVVSVTAIFCFIAGCAAIAYVLMLRQQG